MVKPMSPVQITQRYNYEQIQKKRHIQTLEQIYLATILAKKTMNIKYLFILQFL